MTSLARRGRARETARERSRALESARARSRASSSSLARSRDRDDGAASRVRRGRWGGRTRVRGTRRARASIDGLDLGLGLGLGLRRLDHRRGRRARRAPASVGNAGTMASYAALAAPARAGRCALLDASGATRSGFRVSGRGAVTVDACRWALGTLAHCSRAKRRETASALGALLREAEEAWETLASDAFLRLKTRERAKRAGYLLLTSDVDATDGDEALRAEALGRGGGRISEKMYARDAAALEPNLSEHARAGGGLFFDRGWSVMDLDALMEDMRESILREFPETRFVDARATSVEKTTANASVVRLDDGDAVEDVDVVVVAAGAYSKDLASQCGDVLPLDTERGYHVEFDVDEFPISRAVCYSPGGFIVSPMEDRRTNRKFIRAAGLIELGGLDAPPTARAFDDLEASTRALFKPGALPRRRDPRRDWLGFRPTLPDYVPVIGRASANENVIYAFGHQHVGLTLAAITGRLVGELAAGRTPSVNLDAYSPRRFRDAWWWRGT